MKPSRRRPCVAYLRESYQVSERRACRVCRLDRETCRYQSCLNARTELRLRMREIAKVRVRYGYRKIRVLLNREDWNGSRYLAYRLYQEEVSPCGRSAVADAELQSHVGSGFVAQLRTKFGVWISSPIS